MLSCNLFQLLAVYSIPKNAQIQRFYNLPDNSHVPDHKPLDVSYRLPTLEEFKAEFLHPTKTLSFILKATLFAVCIVALILCCCWMVVIQKDCIKMVYEPSKNEIQDSAIFYPQKTPYYEAILCVYTTYSVG